MRRWVAAVALLCIALAVQAADKGETTTQKARPITKPKATTTPRTTTAKAPKVTPGKRPGVPLGVRQQEEYVDPAIIKEVFDNKKDPSGERYGASPGGSYGGGHGGGPPLMEEEPLSQEFICSVFGGPSCPQDQPALDVPCECEGHELCHCVPYYQCDKGSGAYNEFGVGVIDIRNGNSNGNSSKNTEVGNRNGNSTCPHYIYKCCKTSTMGPPHQPTHEPYHPEPHPEPEPQHTEPPYHPPEHHTEPPYHPPEHHTEPPYHPPEHHSEPPYHPPEHHTEPPYHPPEHHTEPPYHPPEHPPEHHTEPPYHPPEQHTQPPYHPKPEPEYPPPYPEHPEPHPEPEPYPTRPPPQHPEPHYPHQRMRCGQRNAEGVGVRITGDEDGEAQFGEFPWMVAILKVETSDDEKKRNLYQCGGALITPQVVLTAAHCVKKGGGFHHLKVRAGEWDTQTSKEMYRHQDVAVEHVIIHPDYYGGAVHNDVALLFLASPVHIGYHIGTICMPEQDANFDYQKCFVSGWGKDKFGQHGRYQVILKKLELPIVPHGHCQEQLRKTRLGQYFNLHHSFICAGGEEGRDTCKGDGGSPLVCPIPGEPGRYQLAGTVAWGIDCGLAGVPGVYGNVALFRHWVDEQLRSRNIADTPYIP